MMDKRKMLKIKKRRKSERVIIGISGKEMDWDMKEAVGGKEIWE